MPEPHICQNCQFCIPMHGKNKDVIRLECWKYPPYPLSSTDADGKPKIMFVRPKVEGGSKCAGWQERRVGFW